MARVAAAPSASQRPLPIQGFHLSQFTEKKQAICHHHEYSPGWWHRDQPALGGMNLAEPGLWAALLAGSRVGLAGRGFRHVRGEWAKPSALVVARA